MNENICPGQELLRFTSPVLYYRRWAYKKYGAVLSPVAQKLNHRKSLYCFPKPHVVRKDAAEAVPVAAGENAYSVTVNISYAIAQ